MAQNFSGSKPNIHIVARDLVSCPHAVASGRVQGHVRTPMGVPQTGPAIPGPRHPRHTLLHRFGGPFQEHGAEMADSNET